MDWAIPIIIGCAGVLVGAVVGYFMSVRELRSEMRAARERLDALRKPGDA